MMCGGHREIDHTFQKLLLYQVHLMPFQYFKGFDIEWGSVSMSMIQIKIEPSEN